MTRRGAPSFIHQAAIDMLARRWPGIQRRGFRPAFIAATHEDFDSAADDPRNLPEIRPDAYVINNSDKTVTIFEVEDSSKIDAAKMRKLVQIWFAMDTYEWDLQVIVCDRYGSNQHELNMVDYYMAAIDEDIRRRNGA